MTQSHSPAGSLPGINSLEIRGSLTLRLSHDLTNQLAVLAGHLLLLELTGDDADSRRNSILKMREASEAAGGLIAQLNQFQSRNVASSTQQSSEGLVSLFRESPLAASWKLRNDWVSPAPLAICGRWVVGAIEYLSCQLKPACGSVVLTNNRSNAAGGWTMEVQWASARPWLDADETRKPKEFAKAVVFELLQAAGCAVEYASSAPDLNTLGVHLPPI